MPATAQAMWSSSLYIFSLLTPTAFVSSSFEVIFFSAANTTPSVARTPSAEPALEMASIAYST